MLLMSVKKIISPEVWGRRFLTKPNQITHHPPPSKSNARPLTKFSCIDGSPIAINRYGIRYKNLLAITSLHGNVTTIV